MDVPSSFCPRLVSLSKQKDLHRTIVDIDLNDFLAVWFAQKYNSCEYLLFNFSEKNMQVILLDHSSWINIRMFLNISVLFFFSSILSSVPFYWCCDFFDLPERNTSMTLTNVREKKKWEKSVSNNMQVAQLFFIIIISNYLLLFSNKLDKIEKSLARHTLS